MLLRLFRIENLFLAALSGGLACNSAPADDGSPASGGQAGTSVATGGSSAGSAGASGAPTGGVTTGGTAGSATTGGTPSGGTAGTASTGGTAGSAPGGGAGVGGGAPGGGGSGGAVAGASGTSFGGAAGSLAGAGGQSGASGSGGKAAGGAAGTSGLSPTCGTRTGGAMVDMRICNQTLRLWVTNTAFITEALRLRTSGGARIACFPGLRDGRDCDAAYTWNADPALAYWSDFELETYFACPAAVEADKSNWVEQVQQVCGQMTTVTAVNDRR